MYTFLQRKEIDLGKAYGLNSTQIAFYANPKFNHLKMEILRRALEWGVPIAELKKLLVPCVSLEEMREAIEIYKSGGQIAYFSQRKDRTWLYLSMSFLIVSAVFIFIVSFLSASPLPYQILKREITISCQDELDVKSLVRVNGGVKVDYPSTVSRSPGKYILEYIFYLNDTTIHEYISLHVLNDEKTTQIIAENKQVDDVRQDRKEQIFPREPSVSDNISSVEVVPSQYVDTAEALVIEDDGSYDEVIEAWEAADVEVEHQIE